MKIAYTISGLYNSGGMENILLQKVNYMADNFNYDISIITTDQRDREVYFNISPAVKLIDIDVNYDLAKDHKWWHLKKYFLKRKHKKELKKVLMSNKFDICISLMDFDFEFLTTIKDGSKKIAEYHFTRYAKVLATENKIIQAFQRVRTYFWKKRLKKFDKFIVLTEQDKRQWGKMSNIEVIPNFINELPSETCDPKAKRILSIGRMEYQKGYDLLLEAWRIASNRLKDWTLTIYGGGDRSNLERTIKEKKLERIVIHPPTPSIGDVYSASSLYVLSSRYEGLPLVLLEAMSYGLSIVSFECPCGPIDLLKPGFGKLVKTFDTLQLANSIVECAHNYEWRVNAIVEAKNQSHFYSKELIMEKWNMLFSSMLYD